MEKHNSSLQRTRPHCSRVQGRHAFHYCIQHFALGDEWLQLQLLPWSSPCTVLELIWRPQEVWRSVAMNSIESWQILHTMRLLQCPPLPVVPKRSYNTVDYFGVKTFPDWACCMSEALILSQMFAKRLNACLILYTSDHGSDWNTWLWLFGWVKDYFYVW